MLAASLMLCLDDVLDVISIFGDLTRKNPPFPYWKFETIDVQLSDMSEAEVRAEFRFAPSEIDLLRQALRVLQKFTCMNGTVAGMISVQVPTSLCMQNKLSIHSRYCFVEQYVYPREPNIYMGNLYLRDE